MTSLKSYWKRYACMVAVLSAGLVASAPATAGSKVFAFFGSTMTFNGTTEANAFGNVDPFVIEVFAAANECLRIAVTFQGADLEATLVSPDGRYLAG